MGLKDNAKNKQSSVIRAIPKCNSQFTCTL